MDRNLLPFDATIVQYLNDKIGTFHELDTALFVLSGNPLAKGMLLMARCGGSTSANPEWGTVRRLPTGTVFGPVTGSSADRAGNRALVAKPWPFHPRPLSNPALTLKVFSADDPNYFRKWNSFPSDHPVQFCAMSLAIATRPFWVGLCAFAWSFLVILLPRLYFGYHYPSDIAAGAALGMSVMAVALWAPAPPRLAMAIHQLGERYSGLRQAALFVISAEVAQNFDDLRALLQALKVV